MNEIARCPNPECGAECRSIMCVGSKVGRAQIYCTKGCGYLGVEATGYEAAIRLHNAICAVSDDGKGQLPFAYAYRYDNFMGGTVIRFNNGEEVNGTKPFEAIPLYSHPAPQGWQQGAAETLEHVHITDKQAVITGDPADLPESVPEDDPRRHSCDAMGCPTLDHVLYRLPFTDHRKSLDTKELAKELAERIDFTTGPVQAREAFETILKRHQEGNK